MIHCTEILAFRKTQRQQLLLLLILCLRGLEREG